MKNKKSGVKGEIILLDQYKSFIAFGELEEKDKKENVGVFINKVDSIKELIILAANLTSRIVENDKTIIKQFKALVAAINMGLKAGEEYNKKKA